MADRGDDIGYLTDHVDDLGYLPNLPHYKVAPFKDRHHKTQTWQTCNGTRMEMKEGLTHERPKFVKAKRAPESWNVGSLPDSTTRSVFREAGDRLNEQPCEMPAWDAFDRHVLRFYCFFKEPVVESNLEHERIRNVVLYYYLEDDTCHVVEPRTDNSGLPQGQLIRRHRFPSPDGGYMKPQDLTVGTAIPIYGRTLHISDCDSFTRTYFEQAGMEQGPAEESETDAFKQTRDAMKITSATAPRTYEKVYREVMLGGGHINSDMQQFLECDRKVLRFFAVMDDLHTPQFERRPFILLFFLADDQIEIREMYPLNCGRDNFPIFFRKAKMARGKHSLAGPQAMPRTKSDFVDGREFLVGEEVALSSNKFFVYDADDFTRAYFRHELHTELAPRVDVRLPERAVPRATTPPYTGYGSWDDSMSSVTHLIPKVPQRDTDKLAKYSGMVLRFKARFNHPKPEDSERVFVISFFLQDDCMSIHEPPQRNLGIVTGRFLEKGVHMNQVTGAIVKAEDIMPGNVLKVYNHEFEVLDMDEYTRKLCADPENLIKTFDLEAVKEKLRESMRQQFPRVADIFRRFDTDHDEVITVEEFKKALERFGFNLNPADVYTLMRHFDTRGDGQVSYNEFCDMFLDEDYPCGKRPEKAPLDQKQDLAYVERANQRLVERKETGLVRNAVRQFGDILTKREGMVMKVIKEFRHLTHEDLVSVQQIQEALSKTGHCMELDNIVRVVCHLLGGNANLARVDYLALIKAAKTSFHDFSAKR